MKTSLFFSTFASCRRILLLVLAFPAFSYAADTPARAAAEQAVPVIATSPMNLVWGILFLCALVAAAWWLVRRSGGLQIQGGRGMKVIAALPVGPRERVVLIEIAGEQWLLGVAPGTVNLLHRFEQPILQGAGNDDFASRIRAVLQQGVRK